MKVPKVSERPENVLKNPPWFPITFDWDQGSFGLAKTSRENLSALAFLDGREKIGEETKTPVSISDILKTAPRPKAPLFIFHSGFCCSTLVARCLDKPGVCLSLKEPGILNTFSNLKTVAETDFLKKRFDKSFEAGIRLFHRRFSKKEKVLIKASNFDTPLIPEVRKIFPEAKILLIRQDLKSFLISVAKGGKPRRKFVCALWGLFQRISEMDKTYPLLSPQKKPAADLSDLHFAALAWLWQISLFQSFEGPKTKTLECGTFLENPARALKEVGAFFDLSASPGEGEIEKEMTRHAKAPEFAFTPEKRRQEMRTLEAYLKPVLPEILEWAEEISPLGEKNPPIKLAG